MAYQWDRHFLIFYFTDVGALTAVRYEDYKVHFMVQEDHGFDVWKQPYIPQAWSSLVDLRADPFERAMHESIGYGGWATSRMFSISAAAVITQNILSTSLVSHRGRNREFSAWMQLSKSWKQRERVADKHPVAISSFDRREKIVFSRHHYSYYADKRIISPESG